MAQTDFAVRSPEAERTPWEYAVATTEQFSKLVPPKPEEPDLIPRKEAKGYALATAIAALLWGGIAAGSVYFLL